MLCRGVPLLTLLPGTSIQTGTLRVVGRSPRPRREGTSRTHPFFEVGRVTESDDRAVRFWLIAVAALVFAMIAVGGATRLTGSGLSITEWQPILGVIPPLSEADWQSAFSKYKEIPQYRLVNEGMTLDAFKMIYWWEWTHRSLGRLIGVLFAVPLLLFWAMGRLRPGLAPKLLGVLAVGGLQGLMGWYMVKSGLVDRVGVSQYRLAAHLSLAFLLLGLLTWLALSVGTTSGKEHGLPLVGRRMQGGFAIGILALIFSQVVLGAFVAGTNAGRIYNTWPLMDGGLVPPGIGMLEPWYRNLGENRAAIQFNHRMMAYAIAIITAAHVMALFIARSPERHSGAVLGLAVLAQAGLGVWTLLAAVPLSLGLAHQAGAAALLVIAVWHVHRLTARALSPVLAVL